MIGQFSAAIGRPKLAQKSQLLLLFIRKMGHLNCFFAVLIKSEEGRLGSILAINVVQAYASPNKKYHRDTENSRGINSVLKSNGPATPQTNDPHILQDIVCCYKMVHPEIEPYRKWGCPTYEELYTIFIKPKVTGEQAIVIGGDRSGRNYLAHSRENVNTIVLHGYNKRQSA
nr:hypothetical protein CFP56_60535 [Quercus suber]